MAFQYPELIRKGTKIEDLSDENVRYWHEKMHIFWNQIESGTIIPDWNLQDVYDYHIAILNVMRTKKIKHISPINTLDMIKEV